MPTEPETNDTINALRAQVADLEARLSGPSPQTIRDNELDTAADLRRVADYYTMRPGCDRDKYAQTVKPIVRSLIREFVNGWGA